MFVSSVCFVACTACFLLGFSTLGAIPTIKDGKFDRVGRFLPKLDLMMILSRETFPLNQFHRNLLSIKNAGPW